MQTQRKVHVRAYKTTGHIGRKIQHAADIQARIQLLDAELKELRTEFLAHMEATGLDRMEVGDFRITRKVRHCWNYTPETAREILKLQQTQRWEQSQGLASDNPTAYIALTTIV
jgi:hypothetical protein